MALLIHIVNNVLSVSLNKTFLSLTDPPTFIEPLKDLMVLTRDSARFECRVDGTPAPSVKWNKDWRPISETARVKLKHRSPDHWSLSIDNAKYMDSGQYEVLAENLAGKVYCSAKLTVEGKCELVSSELKNVAGKVYLAKFS